MANKLSRLEMSSILSQCLRGHRWEDTTWKRIGAMLEMLAMIKVPVSDYSSHYEGMHKKVWEFKSWEYHVKVWAFIEEDGSYYHDVVVL